MNSGTRAERNCDAMQPPVGVPANGGPETVELVTRPLGAKVTDTRACPDGSLLRRQPDAFIVASRIANDAADELKGTTTAGSSG